MANNVTAPTPTRLPVPADYEPARWRILTEVVFPNATDPRVIALADQYCSVRKLNIFKRPIAIVKNWDTKLGRYVEQIWPGINDLEVTAARTGQYAGCDPTVFGSLITKEFKGRVQERGNWVDKVVAVTYPETASTTVYRLVGGVRCPFTVPVRWTEEYARIGGSELPNYMWSKRPHDQFAKVSRAASLRAAFPEEGDGPTAEEMDGQAINVDQAPTPKTVDAWQPPPSEPDHDPATGELLEPDKPHALELIAQEGVVESWQSWGQRLLARVNRAPTVELVDAWQKANEARLKVMESDAPKLQPKLLAAIGKRRLALAAQQPVPEGDADAAPDDQDQGEDYGHA